MISPGAEEGDAVGAGGGTLPIASLGTVSLVMDGQEGNRR